MTSDITTLIKHLRCPALTSDDDIAPYLTDASQAASGHPLAVFLPRTTADVSTILRFASTHQLPVSVRGAGTGLAGGAAAYAGGLVISTEAMTELSIDAAGRLADVQPGVLTATLDAAAQAQGLFFAPDPASAATSTVGGNIATNAGGLRCLAHGVTADSVAALEVVLASGEVIQTGARTIKNVAGLNLTPLFVGSEGTLGVITRATVRLKPLPEGTPYTFAAYYDSLEDAGAAVLALTKSGLNLESLELIDRTIVQLINKHHGAGLTAPGAGLLMGLCTGTSAQTDAARAASMCAEQGASSTETVEGLTLMEACRLVFSSIYPEGFTVLGDADVPVPQLPHFIRRIQEISKATSRPVLITAHAGDGNLHPSVYAGAHGEETEAAEAVLAQISAAALELGGTVTGEHGIGSAKLHALEEQLTPATLAAGRAIKATLDPAGILTPGRGI